MGEWNENDERWLDIWMRAAKVAAAIMLVIAILCTVGTMDYNDQISASAIAALFYTPEPPCEDRSAEWGRATVTVCGSKSKPLTKMISE